MAVALCAPPRVNAGTPEEAQLAGSIHAALSSFIIAEFGGRTRENPHFHQRPVCGPNDYEALKEAAKDRATLIDFHARCRLVETKIERLQVHGYAYLPLGYCERIKSTMVEAMSRGRGNLSSVRLEISCHSDGSIQLTAQRNREPVRLAAEDVSTMSIYQMIRDNLTHIPILTGIILSLLLSRWISLLTTAAIVGFVMNFLYFAGVLLEFPGSFGGRWLQYVIATIAVYVFWAAIFFMIRQFVVRYINSPAQA